MFLLQCCFLTFNTVLSTIAFNHHEKSVKIGDC
uniref:Uncharacterized protein n=1 Tax=Heterorhabditis bacteriophora TaxID=37862 RepID=A0A1I7W7T6_HETBA